MSFTVHIDPTEGKQLVAFSQDTLFFTIFNCYFAAPAQTTLLVNRKVKLL